MPAPQFWLIALFLEPLDMTVLGPFSSVAFVGDTLLVDGETFAVLDPEKPLAVMRAARCCWRVNDGQAHRLPDGWSPWIQGVWMSDRPDPAASEWHDTLMGIA